ncbi:MAG: aspartate aminotransferase family protein, partial [Candidatus Kuenenia sp.]|nr:aspartate aminotransferase family protein [Candidatus Kuenenia sp.]
LVKGDKIPAFDETDNILEQLKDLGILAGKTGISRNVLTFQPPLVITQNDIDHLCVALKIILSKVSDG